MMFYFSKLLWTKSCWIWQRNKKANSKEIIESMDHLFNHPRNWWIAACIVYILLAITQTARSTLELTELQYRSSGGPRGVYLHSQRPRSYPLILTVFSPEVSNTAACCQWCKKKRKDGMSALIPQSRCSGNRGLKHQWGKDVESNDW